jgi:hypothetical protein
MKTLPLLALTTLVFTLSNHASAEPPDLDAALYKLIESYGGETNLHKLDSQIQEWAVVALMDSRHGTDVRAIRAPQQLRVELRYPHKSETRIINGDASYTGYDDAPLQEAVHPRSDAMRLQLMRLYSPLVLRDMRDNLTLTIKGEYCALTLSEYGLRVDYLINMANWHIEKVIGTMTINGTAMRFLTEYSDFKFRDGVLVHERENKYAGAVNTAVLQLDRIILDADLNEEYFQPDGEVVPSSSSTDDDVI